MRRLAIALGFVIALGLVPAGVASATEATEATDVRMAGELPVEWEQQINGYYCGPTATRMALKAQSDSPPSQDDLAAMLGTDTNGTDHVGLVKDVMNDQLGTDYYTDTYLDYSPTDAQTEQFWADTQATIDDGYAIVANIWVVDGGPRPDGYPSGEIMHYVTVIGYSDDGNVLVADPTAGRPGFENVPEKYWIDYDTMATLIGGKGYAA